MMRFGFLGFLAVLVIGYPTRTGALLALVAASIRAASVAAFTLVLFGYGIHPLITNPKTCQPSRNSNIPIRIWPPRGRQVLSGVG